MTKRHERMEFPEELNEEKVMKRWHKAIRAASSLARSAFQNGKVKTLTKRELTYKLKNKGITADDVDSVINEAERRKLISIDYRSWSSYHWVPKEDRVKEKQKTQRLEKSVENVFLSKKVTTLTEDELKEALLKTGLSPDEVKQALYEAERDCIIGSSVSSNNVWEYVLIPPKARKTELKMRRLEKLLIRRRLYKKIMQGLEE
ncbi:MAG: hypothetical protein QXO47_04205 [Thermoproteota archaeon]|nr:hypothetical protein [Candidatus Brockarchaeota archaeon]